MGIPRVTTLLFQVPLSLNNIGSVVVIECRTLVSRPCCLKLGLNNPELLQNLNSDMKALKANVQFQKISIHLPHGGVVPEIAYSPTSMCDHFS